MEHPASWWALRQVSPVRELAGGYATRDREREELRVLGLNVRRHPLADPGHRNALDALGVTPSRQILELPHGSRTRAAGILESLQSPPTKSGNPIWFLQIEDEHGTAPVDDLPGRSTKGTDTFSITRPEPTSWRAGSSGTGGEGSRLWWSGWRPWGRILPPSNWEAGHPARAQDNRVSRPA